MTHRIEGDDADLPHGWTVDEDNWGKRLVRNGDCDRIKAIGDLALECFIEDGELFVMRADVAVALDTATINGKGSK